MGSILVTFEPVILGIHFLVAIFLIIVILLQAGKGTDIGSAFGAGGSQSVFGVRGAATLLSKVTTIVAMVFLLTSISLATVAKYEALGEADGSAIEKELLNEKKQPIANPKAADPTQVDPNVVPQAPQATPPVKK